MARTVDLGSVIGPQGPKGDTGATGKTGAEGKSAYQVWLSQEGNDGKTEEEYLASLKGEKGEKGDAFSIAKTYASVEAMNADFSGTEVKEGQFVMIDTGNVNDADNAKLYVKGAKAFTYITDLSGAAGLTGPQGPKGDTGAKGAAGAAGADGKTPELSIDENGHLIATYPD